MYQTWVNSAIFQDDHILQMQREGEVVYRHRIIKKGDEAIYNRLAITREIYTTDWESKTIKIMVGGLEKLW